MTGANYVGLAVGAVAIVLVFFGEGWQRAWAGRKLRRHHCPGPCLESIKCRCGCHGGRVAQTQQNACGRCGTPIVYDEEDDDDRDWGPYSSGAITQEIPRPVMRQTSWGKAREEEEEGVR